eukprot:TRINITY_DN2760_c0_g1_i1.p1 TRINITY_DN2760_c0_g1~~TRINITY_DN2760_c0_g1_i1.p1  ORF type:complete len:222 (+),score=69.47 TRINITY_DN2760_c0_g1_i1:181-846(+)
MEALQNKVESLEKELSRSKTTVSLLKDGKGPLLEMWEKFKKEKAEFEAEKVKYEEFHTGTRELNERLQIERENLEIERESFEDSRDEFEAERDSLLKELETLRASAGQSSQKDLSRSVAEELKEEIDLLRGAIGRQGERLLMETESNALLQKFFNENRNKLKKLIEERMDSQTKVMSADLSWVVAPLMLVIGLATLLYISLNFLVFSPLTSLQELVGMSGH